MDRRREPKPSLPKMPGKDASAGPFYLIWQNPNGPMSRTNNGRICWKTGSGAVPKLRWPQLAVDAALSADAPARRGEEVFVTQCIPCHQLNGGGASDIGPDLGQPMGATDYLTEAGLRALVRDPKSVRTWPQQQMPAFPLSVLPDTDLDALIAYLRQIAANDVANRAPGH